MHDACLYVECGVFIRVCLLQLSMSFESEFNLFIFYSHDYKGLDVAVK